MADPFHGRAGYVARHIVWNKISILLKNRQVGEQRKNIVKPVCRHPDSVQESCVWTFPVCLENEK